MRCLLAGWFWLVLTAVGAFPSRVWPGRRWAGIHPQALPQADLQALTHFYNSLTGRIQAFSPLSPPKVLFYSCGPTVYDYAHIGNLRAFLTYDLIKRWLLYCGYDVDHVCNLTDVDDKILHRMEVEEASLQEITQKYIDAFHQDLQALNILPANRYPKATEHIDDMLHMTNSLVSKGFAYTQLGSVYFNLSAFPSYGQLVSRQKSMLVGDAPHEACGKAHPHDFALWKAASNSSVSWDSPYGRGRPGWHLECSAMAHRWLGPSIDIHSGGEDLKFPHHCNEIAQSEACSGKQLSRFWMHNAFVITKQEKMSKSRHNFVTLRDIAHTALDLRSFRLLVLSSQYRNPLSVSSEALHATRKRIERMDRAVHALQRHLVDGDEEGGSSDVDEAVHQFERAMANDLNTPQATVSYFQLIKLAERECALTAPSPARIRQLWAEIQRVDRVLGLLYSPAVSTPASDSEWEEARRMAEQRLVLKQQQRFREADELREKLRERGYTVQDGRDGYTLSATGTRQTSMAAQ